MIHIGDKIKKIIHLKNVSVSSFAKKINKSRTVVYHIFSRESIDSKLLYIISKELEYNFFDLYFDNKKPRGKEVLDHEIDSYKLKYYSLLERHNKILEKLIN